MRFITWNVNGVRAALGRNALEWAFAQKPDAVCLKVSEYSPLANSPAKPGV